MSDHVDSALEVRIENPVLRELLIKYKEAGLFDMIKNNDGHLLIADKIEDAEYDFYYYDPFFSTSATNLREAKAFPKNVHQLLSYVVAIIADAVWFPSMERLNDFSMFKWDILRNAQEITRSYRYVWCRYYEIDAECAMNPHFEEESFEIDNDGHISYRSSTKDGLEDNMIVSAEEKRAEDYHRLLELNSKRHTDSDLVSGESEAMSALRAIEYHYTHWEGHERNIKNFRIWQRTEEGRRELQKQEEARQKAREEMIKRNIVRLAKNGGDACPIDELDLPKRPYNCLKRANILTVGELRKMTYDDLLHIKNLGRRGAFHIVETLADFGLALS